MFGANTATNNSTRAPLASHPAFSPLIIGWATLLFGACAFIVVTAFSDSGILPIISACVAAIIGAICGFLFARNVGARLPGIGKRSAGRSGDGFGGRFEGSKDEGPEVPDTISRRAASIISTQDLGSESLDSPLELSEADVADDEEWDDQEPTPEAPIAEALVADEVADDSLELGQFEESADDTTEEAMDSAEPLSTYYEDPFAHDSFDEAPSPNDRHRRAALGRAKFMPDEPLPLDGFAGVEDEPVTEPATPIDLDRLTNKAADTGALENDFPLVLEPPFTETGPSGAESASLLSCAPNLAQPASKPTVDLNSTAPHEADAPLLEQTREAEIIELKERDLKDLSLVQMVERFAVGLDDHRVARANDPGSRRIRPSDPRIAQAIRELPIAELKPSGNPATRAEAEQTEAALREALEKLQRMSDHG